MRLIVEVDNYQFEHCKRHVEEHYANPLEEAIVNATPINATVDEVINAVENVRLIRDKLKELKAYDSFEYFVSELLKEICTDEID